MNYNSYNISSKIPRDRNGTFENKFIGKYETKFSRYRRASVFAFCIRDVIWKYY
ncbi:hypothetical protein [Mesomycoplasma ovipneumoniae]|uniref:hypothetical protein n=1 Tax=Mesomycoplasma ovipneumoniae TaxID=29562 RepID=UPI003B52459F